MSSQPAQGQLYLYVLHEFYDISFVQATTYLNRRFQWQNLFCKYNEFNPLNAELNPIRYLPALVGARHTVHISRIRVNYQSLKECWIILLTNLLSLIDNKTIGVLSLMNLHM